LTNDCNLSCPHCPRSVMVRPVSYISHGLFIKIIDEIVRHPNCYLRLVGLGEPALHPQVREILSAIKSRKIKTEFVTNGYLLDVLDPQEIITSGIDSLGISIDGFDSESYAKRRPGGDYEKLKSQVINLWNARQSNGIKKPLIKIRHVAYPNDSIDDLNRYRDYWFAYADMVGFNKYEPVKRKDFQPPYKSCRFIKWETKITWEGKVALCRFQSNRHVDEEIVGDVKNSTIRDIWLNSRMQEARTLHARGNLDTLEYCKSCIKVQSYGDKTVWK
jgi:MoaA/NifB/PqqE/SkfB family radical SAM enzyme